MSTVEEREKYAEKQIELANEYKDKPAVGFYCFSNTMGIEIVEIKYDIDDSIVWRCLKSDDTYEYGESQIDYEDVNDAFEEADLQPCFIVGNAVKIFMNEVMKV